MKKILFLLAFVSIIAVGCSDFKARVESDTSWSGAFGNRTVDGNGNQTIDLDDKDTQCCVVQKQTKHGRLKITIIDEGFLGMDGESAETTAEYGVVSACSK